MPGMYSVSGSLLLTCLLVIGCASASPYEGLTPAQIYDLGTTKYAEEEWSDAIAAYERLLATTPGFDRSRDARYFLAMSFFHNGDQLSAVSEFVRLLNAGSGDTLMPRAALGVCKAYAARSPIPARDQTYTFQAITSCDEVVRDYPGAPVADTAGGWVQTLTEKLAIKDLDVAEWYMKRDLTDSAINYFQDVVDNYPQTSSAPVALLRIFEAYTLRGYDDLAERAKEQLLRDYPETAEAKSVTANGDVGT